MATFETLPHFEASWVKLTREQQATFRAVVLKAFAPDLTASGHPFRRSLRVKPVTGYAELFEMTWNHDGRATFRYGAERESGQQHFVWHEIVTISRSPR